MKKDIEVVESEHEFDSCDNCKYDSDAISVCQARQCFHAFSRLYDCFEPKEIIRCEDCKWFYVIKEDEGFYCCNNPRHFMFTKRERYCSDGETKDD